MEIMEFQLWTAIFCLWTIVRETGLVWRIGSRNWNIMTRTLWTCSLVRGMCAARDKCNSKYYFFSISIFCSYVNQMAFVPSIVAWFSISSIIYWFVLIEYFDYALVEGRLENYVDKSRCNNCEKRNVETKNITLEEYSKIKVKSKREVNPDIIKICPKCDSKDIYSLETTVNQRFSCNNCQEKFFVPKIIEC